MAEISVDQALLKAQSHAKKGEIEEAQKLYKDVLQTFPKNKKAQQDLAALNKPKQPNGTQGPPQDTINQLINLYNKGQLGAVAEQAKALTLQYPDAFLVWNILGAANRGLGRAQAASEAFKRVTELNPTFADGFGNLGVILQQQGKLDEAIAFYNKALSLKPDYVQAYYNMGNALQQKVILDEAIVCYNKALSLKPDYAEAYYNMGIALKMQGKLDEAIVSFQKALELKHDYVEAYYNIGTALQEQGMLDEAITSYQKAISLKPDHAGAFNNMGNAFKTQGKLDEAIVCYNKALSLKPDHAGAYNNMGNAFKAQGKLDEAIASYLKAASLKPDYAEAYNNMGLTFQEQGKGDAAIASYNKALSLKPDYVAAHMNLSTLIKYKPESTQITLVVEMIQRTDLNDNDRCQLQYTFAKMNEDLGDLATAYDNYVAGGKLRKKLLSYHFKQDEILFDQIKNTAPKIKEFSLDKPIETTTNIPIFILGMPRSGTTLVEQIISSHSKVYGAGELRFIARFGGPLSRGNQTISSDNIVQIRNTYLHELEKVSNGCQFVTDKMPQNFRQIGLILKVLPEAKVIHVKREPAATCWSNFKHYFSATGLGYSCDLKDTVNYFKLYQDLMEFWDQQYGEHIYHLDYDKLTLEQEEETRKLIQHLGLDWEDNCLSPQDNQRSVRTASRQQVRQKVYTGSSQAWRKFEPYLNGAFDSLTP